MQGATFFFNCPRGPEEPPCPLDRFHRWYLPKPSFAGGTRFTVEKGSLVFTFATCGWMLRRDEDGPAWMEWAAMWHALHVAPTSVAEAVERNWVVQRPTACGGVEYSCGCMDYCDNYGEVCTLCACDTYAPRTYGVRASYALRFSSYVLTFQHVRVGPADRTCWGSNTYELPERIIRVVVPTRTCCPSRSYALMYQRVRVACADHACHFTECHPYPSSLAVARDPLQVQGAAPLAL